MMSGGPLRAPPIPNDAVSERLRSIESDRLRGDASARVESLVAPGPIADTPGLSASNPAQVGCDALVAMGVCAKRSAGPNTVQLTAYFSAVYDFDNRRIDVPRN